MKKKIAIISFIVMVIIIFSLLCSHSIYGETRRYDVSPKGDESIVATLTNDGKLTITQMSSPSNKYDFLNMEYIHLYKDRVKNVEMYVNLTAITANMFKNFTNLESVRIINNTTTVISPSAFEGCVNLKSIILPTSITTIYSRVFFNCVSLSSINIPEGARLSGSDIFSNCPLLAPKIILAETPQSNGTKNLDISLQSKGTTIPTNCVSVNGSTFSSTKHFNIAENGTYTIQATDSWGNISKLSKYIVVDSTPPTINSVTGNPTNYTNQNVTLTVNATDNQRLAADAYSFNNGVSWQASNKKTYTQNTNGIVIKVKDYNGNIATYPNINIDKIDKIAPKVTTTYSTKNQTNGSVTVTITSNKQMQVISGWTLSSNKLSMTKVYTKNTVENVIVKDLAGNTTVTTVSITNVDKTPPQITVSYSPTTPTKGNVKVTLKSNKAMQAVSTWTLSADKKSMTKTYSANKTEQVTIKDTLGNTTKVTVQVSNIDKTAPQITNFERGMLQLTVSAKDDMKLASNAFSWDGGRTWTSSRTYRIEKNGDYKVLVKDFAGNIATSSVIKVRDIKGSWDVSVNKDNTVRATLLEDGKLLIRGKGAIKNWTDSESPKTKWHNLVDMKLITKIEIGSGITSVGERAFRGCENVTSVSLPSTLATIKLSAFNGCIKLTKINIPTSVTRVEDYAFGNCDGLAPNITLNLRDSLPVKDTKMYVNLASRGTKLNAKPVSYNSSEQWTASTEYSISKNGTYTVYARDEWGNQRSKSIKVSNIDTTAPQITNFERGVLQLTVTAKDDFELAAYSWDGGKTWTKSDTFRLEKNGDYRALVKDLAGNIATSDVIKVRDIKGTWDISAKADGTVKATLLEDGRLLIRGKGDIKNWSDSESPSTTWHNLTDSSLIRKIEIGNGITSIGERAFRGCENVTSVSLPSTLTTIKLSAFNGCTNLGKVNIPSSVKTIQDYAFGNCNELAPAIKVDYNTEPTRSITLNVGTTTKGTRLADKPIAFLNNQQASYGTEKSLKITENGTYKVYAKDEWGNERYSEIQITNIDKTAPEIEVTGNATHWTKDDVTLTINVVDLEAGLAQRPYSFDGGATWQESNTKTYTQNTNNICVQVKDQQGGVHRHSAINITYIDKVAPKASVVYSTTDLTNKDVNVTIDSEEELQDVEGWQLSENRNSMSKKYEANAEERVTIQDLAGNTTDVGVTIQNIDKEVTGAKVEYSTLDSTNQKVVVTISAEEELNDNKLQVLAGWTLSEDKRIMTKDYETNVQEEVIVKDLIGNEAILTVKIENIDKTSPTNTAPTVTSTSSTILTRFNQEDDGTGIDVNTIQYAIKRAEDDEWEGWISSEKNEYTFKSLNGDTLYEVKTRVKDQAGNGYVESQVASIKTTNADTFLYGDVTGDNVIDITDIVKVKKHILAGDNDSWKLTEEEKIRADVNQDGEIDVLDVIMIKKDILEIQKIN